jgi:hypothetical protein
MWITNNIVLFFISLKAKQTPSLTWEQRYVQNLLHLYELRWIKAYLTIALREQFLKYLLLVVVFVAKWRKWNVFATKVLQFFVPD